MAQIRHASLIPVLLALGACHQQEPPHPLTQYKERAQKGPYVSTTVQISPTESVSTLVIPSEFGPILDQHCWIYRNLEFKLANMACGAETLGSQE